MPSSMTTGYTIFDHQGRPIGVWFSSLTGGMTVDPVAKAVSIATLTWRKPEYLIELKINCMVLKLIQDWFKRASATVSMDYRSLWRVS